MIRNIPDRFGSILLVHKLVLIHLMPFKFILFRMTPPLMSYCPYSSTVHNTVMYGDDWCTKILFPDKRAQRPMAFDGYWYDHQFWTWALTRAPHSLLAASLLAFALILIPLIGSQWSPSWLIGDLWARGTRGLTRPPLTYNGRVPTSYCGPAHPVQEGLLWIRLSELWIL